MGGGHSKKGVRYDARSGTVRSCIFCDIAAGRMKPGRKGEETEILLETDEIVVFAPRDPQASKHLLAVPKKHIRTVRSENISRGVLKRMLFAGVAAADGLKRVPSASASASVDSVLASNRNRLFRFHLPPFNSIDHVHLHIFEAPFNSWYSRLKYADNAIWGLSFERAFAEASGASRL
eukprot:g3270.t1